jgi:hypothetical protein
LLLATLQKFFHEEDDCLGCVKCFFYSDADLNHFVSIFYCNHGLRYDDEYKEAYLIRFDEELINNSYDKAYEDDYFTMF